MQKILIRQSREGVQKCHLFYGCTREWPLQLVTILYMSSNTYNLHYIALLSKESKWTLVNQFSKQNLVDNINRIVLCVDIYNVSS